MSILFQIQFSSWMSASSSDARTENVAWLRAICNMLFCGTCSLKYDVKQLHQQLKLLHAPSVYMGMSALLFAKLCPCICADLKVLVLCAINLVA